MFPLDCFRNFRKMCCLLYAVCCILKAMVMHLSIKFVVATLLVLVSLCALVLACIPILYRVHNDTMNFVLDAVEGAADQAQFVIEGKMHALQQLGDVLFKATQQRDLIPGLQPWPLVLWAGTTVIQDDISVLLFRDDDYGFLVLAHTTITTSAVPWPGHIYLVNLSRPGSYVTYGYFNLAEPHQPANTASPWTLVANPIRYTTQAVGVRLLQPNRSLSMEWIGLTAVRANASAVYSLLTYGGPIFAGGKPANKQYLALSMRGTTFSEYLKNMSVVRNGGACLLFDVTTQALVATSTSDVSGIFVGNGTGAATNRLSHLKDPRVASVFAASYADGSNGLQAVTTCTPPCTFVYWPHTHTLHDGPTSSAFNLDVLVRSFVVVRVLRVSGSKKNHDQQTSSSSTTMNLRLMVAAPSNSPVIGGYVSALQNSILMSVSTICVLCACLVVFSYVVLQPLAEVELEVSQLAQVFLVPLAATLDGVKSSDDTLAVRHGNATSVFIEFSRITGAVRCLSRALYTLRAFTPTGIPIPTFVSPLALERSTTTVSASLSPHGHSISQPPSDETPSSLEVPYDSRGAVTLWRVPVTTLLVDLDFTIFRSKDSLAVVNFHRLILSALQQRVASFPGASVDQFYGNRFLIHFNASGRTHKHALAALSVALRTLREVPDGLSFGISSSISLCGYMGPPLCKVFTVVSTNVPHAALMAKLAPAFRMLGNLAVPMTWRATELAKQEQRALSTRNLSTQVDRVAASCFFKPLVEVFLQGEEVNIPPFAFAVIPVLSRPGIS
ncbi:GPI-anchored surface protein, putative [Bodo saltans]|uniref:GPI-anchored surface protein, putative n=1 Tax=Bodo saltans TaxID=75058 RepID=A0A0S4IL21_BODSA|nr:GPI-anchored surface protein, putative [Bodo saltans]|eukprot:CUF19435.1 GPI-anchored surface protein, putative [Bodo saltans]